MSVILRHAFTGFFYLGPHCWINGRAHASDLGTIENAIETGREEDFGSMEIVACAEDPECQLVLPLHRRKTGAW